MDTRTILDFDFPNEITQEICKYLGNDDVYRLSATCRFFSDKLNDYKVDRLTKRVAINENMTANNCNIIPYVCSGLYETERLFHYKNIMIGISWTQLCAWDRDSGKIVWVHDTQSYRFSLDRSKISIVGNKIVCMIDNRDTNYGEHVPYILVLAAESGVLHKQHEETKNFDNEILTNLTAFTDVHIIIKRRNGRISCYDTNLNVIESYQSQKDVDDGDDYRIILATSVYIVDIDFCFITIIDRYNNSVKEVLAENDISAAYVDQNRLICGFIGYCELPTIAFQIFDLSTAKVVYEYKNKLADDTNEAHEKMVINSIAMKGKTVFLVAYGQLYKVNMETNKHVVLEEYACDIPEANIDIHDNYLFVTLGYKNYKFSMWDIECMKDVMAKRKVYDRPSWNNGCLFITNSGNYVSANYNSLNESKIDENMKRGTMINGN